MFTEAQVSHLARMSSDHCPLLAKLFPHYQVVKTYLLFVFIICGCNMNPTMIWFRILGITLMVMCYPIPQPWLNFALKDWNKDVFGNIFYQKNRLLARLNGIQKAL